MQGKQRGAPSGAADRLFPIAPSRTRGEGPQPHADHLLHSVAFSACPPLDHGVRDATTETRATRPLVSPCRPHFTWFAAWSGSSCASREVVACACCWALHREPCGSEPWALGTVLSSLRHLVSGPWAPSRGQ